MIENPFAAMSGLVGVALDLDIGRLQAWAYQCPAGRPIRSSFGVKLHRQTVLIRVEDRAGNSGWGEVWCNFPPGGAEHRAGLARAVVGPLLLERPYAHPFEAFLALQDRTHKLALQCGESGPFAQVAAACDTACWDLVARRAGKPLWRLLDGAAAVPVYASGLEAPDLCEVALQKWNQGYRAFKLKIGFDPRDDAAHLLALRAALPPQARLMVDANQAWSLDEALARTRELEPYGLHWLEEPLACDRPYDEWRTLADGSPVALAAGENLRGFGAFDDAVDYLAFVQPDIGKWGGVSGCYAVGKRAVAAGRSFCPHWLSGGVGQMASLHVLAAVGGAGMLEIDSKPNPLREEIGLSFEIEDGMLQLPQAPGICPGMDMARIERFRI